MTIAPLFAGIGGHHSARSPTSSDAADRSRGTGRLGVVRPRSPYTSHVFVRTHAEAFFDHVRQRATALLPYAQTTGLYARRWQSDAAQVGTTLAEQRSAIGPARLSSRQRPHPGAPLSMDSSSHCGYHVPFWCCYRPADALITTWQRFHRRKSYQHCSEAHLQRYLAEFDFRYSNRAKLGATDRERAEKAVKGIEGNRLTYRRTNERTATPSLG